MMDFLIDTILVVCGEIMLHQTIHNRKYNWNNQSLHHYLSFLTISFIYDLSADLQSNATRWVSLVEHNLLTQPEQPSSLSCFVEFALPNL